MTERGISLHEAVADAIRAGLRRHLTRAAAMGRSTVELDRALTLAGDMEDEDLSRQLRNDS